MSDVGAQADAITNWVFGVCVLLPIAVAAGMYLLGRLFGARHLERRRYA